MTSVAPRVFDPDLHRVLLDDGAFTSEIGRRTEDEAMAWSSDPWEAHSDREVWQAVQQARRRGADIPPVVLRGGSLHDALRRRPGTAPGLEVAADVVAVRIDGQRHWFASHLVARHRRVGGRVVVVSNVPWRGGSLASAESDPTDGLVEVIDAELSVADRLRVLPRRRASARSSSFPRERRFQARAIDIELGRPTPVWLDGTEVAVARYVSLVVEPAALRCSL